MRRVGGPGLQSCCKTFGMIVGRVPSHGVFPEFRIFSQLPYGNRSLEPTVEAMTLDTVFDLASLTKVAATAPAVMLLVEQGKLKLGDSAAKYISAFASKEKRNITIRHLLTHYSVLPADLKPSSLRRLSGQKLLSRIYQLKPLARPGVRFIYSDLGFIILGKIVEKVSGMALDQFTRKNLFEPLGMSSTGFKPQAEMRHRTAPTERTRDGGILRGRVHDPTAARLGGVAGNAGLFSTAQDLARYCAMTLGGGELEGVTIFKPETISLMTSPQSPPSKGDIRDLGWDIQSVYSTVKGMYFSSESFGHTGYTGTSMWLDPATKTSVILLTNRVHPRDRGDIKLLRSKISNAVALAVSPPRAPLPKGRSRRRETFCVFNNPRNLLLGVVKMVDLRHSMDDNSLATILDNSPMILNGKKVCAVSDASRQNLPCSRNGFSRIHDL